MNHPSARGAVRRAWLPRAVRPASALAWMSAMIAALLALSAERATAQTVEVAPAPPPPAVIVAPAPQPVVVAPTTQPQTVYVPATSASYPTTVYTAPQSAPEPARPRRHRQLGAVISGAVMLGVGWVCNIVASLFAGVHLWGSSSSDEWADFRLVGLVPVIGPWVQLSLQPTTFDQDGWGPWLVFDGLLQTAGLAVLIVGIVTMGDDEPAPVARIGDVELTVLPSVGPGQAGLTLLGAF